jgi:ABC-type transport system involved in multi-copper enzyme maturation permease subunit
MLPGPVFNFELMATARRGRFYAVRGFYAAVLFVILWGVYSAWTGETGGELPSKLVSWFAFSTFCGIAIGQLILVLVLTPALVAGVIADEKQRKTLHYLLASRLTSPEIVLGKLLVRMLYVGVLLGVSLPVLSLLVLMGGVDPRLVLLSCGATLTTGWFLASLSIWVSTIARKVREAFFVTYGLEGLWLFAPLILRNLSITAWPEFDWAAHWLAEWIGASNPVEVVWQLAYSVATGGISPSSDLELVAWMMGLQFGFGLVLAVLASWQLRIIFRRQDAGGSVSNVRGIGAFLASRSRWRLWRRPVLGDRPVLWKELHTGSGRGLARLVSLVLTVIMAGFLAYYTIWLGRAAVVEYWEYGRSLTYNYLTQVHRTQFTFFLRVVVPLLYLLGILGVAGSAAATITSEHEEDTWVSLTATDLTDHEIIFGKLLGALKRGRMLAAVIVFLSIIGVIANSIEFVSIPCLIVALGVYGWFAAAIGVWISLHLRSTWRAQFLTIASLLLINVTGQGVLNSLSMFHYSPQIWPGFTPAEIGRLLMDERYLRALTSGEWPRYWSVSAIDGSEIWHAIFSVLSVVTYAALAALLTWHTLRRFKVVAGRAQRSSAAPPSATLLDLRVADSTCTEQVSPVRVNA